MARYKSTNVCLVTRTSTLTTAPRADNRLPAVRDTAARLLPARLFGDHDA